MAKYLYRSCPRCSDYLGVVVPEPPEPVTEVPIDAHCLRCGFKLAWKVVLGRKPILALLWILFAATLSPDRSALSPERALPHALCSMRASPSQNG